MLRLSAAGLLASALLLGAVPAGWTPGSPASDMGRVLAPAEPKPLVLSEAISEHVVGPTLLYYFSPTCPHCRETAGSIVGLAEDLEGRAVVVGVASAASDPKDVLSFVAEFEIPFPVTPFPPR